MQLEDLEVEFGGDHQTQFRNQFGVDERAVERANHVVANACCIRRLNFQMDALEEVADKVAALRQTLDHLIENRTFPYTVHTAQDVHLPVEFPFHMFSTAPQ